MRNFWVDKILFYSSQKTGDEQTEIGLCKHEVKLATVSTLLAVASSHATANFRFERST
jgi:hypothetical protein